MKKLIMSIIVLFIIYSVGVFAYLFWIADPTLPADFRGTAADPQTFMTAEQLEQSIHFSQIRNLIYFLSIPLEWVIYLLILIIGLSSKFRAWSCDISRFTFLQTAIYLFFLSLFAFVLTFPLEYVSYYLYQEYGISTQSFSSWMKDHLIEFWVSYVLTFFIVWVLYYLIRRRKEGWWIFAWLLSIPFILFMMYIQPVIIDPLYNDFYPLQDKELEKEILSLAEQAHIPADRVYEVNMSEKTNALNAYVTGVGANIRIVLWDTTLQRLNQNEVLFVMAHEMGHYVMHHLYWGLLSTILLAFVGLYLTSKLLHLFIQRWGKRCRIESVGDIASLPALLLIISILSFAASPLSNFVSRHYEKQADMYAIQLTEDVEGAIGAFQKLTTASLTQVNPPLLVKLFRYGHPTMLERIHYLEQLKK